MLKPAAHLIATIFRFFRELQTTILVESLDQST